MTGRHHSVFVAALGLLSLAFAPLAGADAVLTGSTYNVSLHLGNTISPFPPATVTFDGVAETFTAGGNLITINESQASLGGGQYQINFILTSNADMFPDVPGSTFGGLNFGGNAAFSNPVDLNFPLDLTSVILSAKNGAGTTLGTFQAIQLINNPTPWDGFFSGSNSWGGFGNGQGFDVQEVSLTFIGTVVPLPSAAWAGLALLSGVAALREAALDEGAMSA